jgi:hypothetical protein
MNRFMELKWSWIEGSHAMRTALLDTLSDGDLAFRLGGETLTLGALCREMGEIEYSYLQSLKTFKQDWKYHNTEPGLDGSVSRLKAWFETLDNDIKEVVAAFSDEDLKKEVDRSGYPMPVEMQLDVYLQSILIFFGKATIYVKAMSKPLPQSFKDYIW